MVLRPLMHALVMTHGITDVDMHPVRLASSYGIAFLTPLSNRNLQSAFCIGSLLHMSNDIGSWCSLALHAGLCAIVNVKGAQGALNCMLAYMLAVHVPLHYMRCWKEERRNGVRFSAAASLPSALVLSTNMNARIAWEMGVWHRPLMQRVALGHIICNDLSPPRLCGVVRAMRKVVYEILDLFDDV